MNRNASSKVAVTVVCSLAAISLLQCNQAAEVLPPPANGGATGQGGTNRNDASLLGDGGNGGNTGPIVTVNLDVIPVSWGELDAPKGPEVGAPSIDSNCGRLAQETVRKPADVLLVLDASLSMDFDIDEDCYCPGTGGAGAAGGGSSGRGGAPGLGGSIGRPGLGGSTGRPGLGGSTGRPGFGGSTGFNPGLTCTGDTADCKTRMEAIKPAVDLTLSQSTYVNWGLKLFPSPDLPTCQVTTGMDVEVGPTSAPAVQQKIDDMELVLGTPTATALKYATDYLKTLKDGNQKFILLATDGEPNCKDGNLNDWDTEGAAAAAAAAKAAGFPVYVVGIGPNLENLTAIAEGGGTKDYYQVSSPQQLVDALSSITKIVGSCTYKSGQEPPDSENVAVYVNKQLIDKSEQQSWVYGDTTQDIKLTGSYCEKIAAGEDTAVEILFGCPGGPPFPTVIP